MFVHRRPENEEKAFKTHKPLQPKPPKAWKTLLAFSPFAGSAIYLTWVRLVRSGALSQLASGCAGANYHTGSRLLDRFICASIKFYREALSPANPPFFTGDVSSIAACAFIPLVESLRNFSPKQVQYPMIIGLAAQTFGRGVIYPLYWAKFISSGAARKLPSESTGSCIHQFEAEGALLASVLGFVLPSIGMSATKSAHWTLAWFVYPITLSLIQKTYTFLRKTLTANYPSDGGSEERAYYILQASYFLQFLYATSFHAAVMGPRLFYCDQLKALMGVTFAIPSIETTSLSEIAYQVVQWDAIVLFTSSLVATLGFARTKTEAMKIAMFDFLATSLCGTGGALAAIWAWRERRLHNERVVYHGVMSGI